MTFDYYSLPLYQLSYRETVSSMGLEPTTLGLLDPRSNQLSYEDLVFTVEGVTNYVATKRRRLMSR